MLPGGKFEPGESVDNPEVTAAREVSEELGVDIELSQLRPWNIARAAAANEAGFEVVGHHVRYVGEFTDELANVQPHAEIEEVRWLDPGCRPGKSPLCWPRPLCRSSVKSCRSLPLAVNSHSAHCRH